MSDIYPLVVVLDRYNGTYSGGKWTAWNLNYVPSKIDADDTECADFFAKNMIVYGRGETPQEAIDDLKMILNCGIPDPDEEDEDDDEEEEKMEPTSVWKIENIDNIWMSQEGDKMSLELKNKDDLTKIILTGDAIKNHNDKFVNMLIDDYNKLLEKIEKLRRENEELKAKGKEISDDNAWFLENNKKLDKENESLKKHINNYYGIAARNNELEEENKNLRIQVRVLEDIKRENEELKNKNEALVRENEKNIKRFDRLKENIDVLKRKYDLERAANEAHHRFFHQYAGKGTEIEFNKTIKDTGEVTYVIVDKDRYQSLKAGSYCAMIHGKIYNTAQLVDRILELEKLKTPTIENFLDEKPSTRADILDQAKKCVCGQREQDYGTPESNFQLIADLWNDYLGNNLSKEKRDFKKELGITHNHKELSVPWEISAMDVAMMMALLKIARIKNGSGSGDSFVDLAGYAACGGELWAVEKKSKDQK